jgi:hypothetical protein
MTATMRQFENRNRIRTSIATSDRDPSPNAAVQRRRVAA